MNQTSTYRGRIAPSPTGLMHLGHARTFWMAAERARQAAGVLVLRNEDLDFTRARSEFVDAFLEDLRWFGIQWAEGPDLGGDFGPYNQSERLALYRSHFELLKERNMVYPCICSRQDVLRALAAPHASEEEPVYPGSCRTRAVNPAAESRVNWRFRAGETGVDFLDGFHGSQHFVGGVDFGDFVVWRHDDLPSYQLACVVDDHFMGITEVVRGADLLLSTARQLLLYHAFGWSPPKFFHCPLLLDEEGRRLAKRHDALSLRTLREQGRTPAETRSSLGEFAQP